MLTASVLTFFGCGFLFPLSLLSFFFFFDQFWIHSQKVGAKLYSGKESWLVSFMNSLVPNCSNPFCPHCRPLIFICYWSGRKISVSAAIFKLVFCTFQKISIGYFFYFVLRFISSSNAFFCFHPHKWQKYTGVYFGGLFSFACILGFLKISCHLTLL